MKPDEQAEYYVGVFSPYMAEFMQYKRAQGLKYETVSRSLRLFSKFLDARGIGDLKINRDTISEWCRLKENETRSTQRLRISYATQFLKYLSEKGFEVILPVKFRQTRLPSAFAPYIFSQDELTRFFKACNNISARTPSVMPTMLPLLFRLLYGCGLRISEALSLQMEDVNLDTGVLTIRKAKFNKDRLVPLSDSLLTQFREYSQTIHKLSTAETPFFMHRDGRKVNKDNIYRWYRKTLWSAGICHGGKGAGPRLHDFRHTFSVHALKSMTDKGIDIYCALPVLSTYLGHASVSATGQYVRLTQEMFPEIIDKASSVAAFVIPGGGAR